MHWRVALAAFLVLFAALLPTVAKDDKHALGKKSKARTDVFQPTPDALPAQAKKAKSVKAPPEVYGLDLWTNLGKEGLDVSHYQGLIDWEQVRATDKNISFVYLKATEGASLVDDTYRRNLEEAKRVGLKVGSYHFYRANVPVADQLANIEQNILKGEQDLVPLIDVETTNGRNHDDFVADLKQFLDEVTRYYGKRPLLYTFYNFYNKHLADDFLNYKLMIARYHDDMPQLRDNRSYVIWQYTSKGRILGIKGHVDRSKVMPGFSLGDILY